MKKVNLLIFLLVIIVSILALTIYLQQSPVPEEVPISTPELTPPPEPEKQPIVHYPVPTTVEEPEQESAQVEAEEKPVPVANKQEQAPQKVVVIDYENFLARLKEFNLGQSLYNLLRLDDFIQRVVATIDNLPQKRLPSAHLPLIPPKGRFIVAGSVEKPLASPENQVRYERYVRLLEALDQDRVMNTYVTFYPLFQKAYERLGYQNAYFNDRLVYVLDHLLETPNPEEPIPLAQPSVLYVYENPLLENLSSGQKLLLRIGPDHRQKMISLLKLYRDRLMSLHP